MDVERTIDLPAPPDEVWEILIDPDQAAEWLGDDADFERVVEEVDAPHRLAYRWDTGSGESTVEITLEELPDGTRVTVVERRCVASVARAASVAA